MLALIIGGTLLLPVRSQAAYNIYLQLTGINGESTNAAFLNQIVAASFSGGLSTPAASGAGGGAAKPSSSNLTITKMLDKSSPTLFLDCAEGKAISQAVLSFQSQVGGQNVFYTIKLNNVQVTSVASSGSSGGDNRPQESISLSFQSIQWTYQIGQQRQSGWFTDHRRL
jgi:type VI secretion system secreted protein Hcp